jgi:hypothetical protein
MEDKVPSQSFGKYILVISQDVRGSESGVSTKSTLVNPNNYWGSYRTSRAGVNQRSSKSFGEDDSCFRIYAVSE